MNKNEQALLLDISVCHLGDLIMKESPPYLLNVGQVVRRLSFNWIGYIDVFDDTKDEYSRICYMQLPPSDSEALSMRSGDRFYYGVGGRIDAPCFVRCIPSELLKSEESK